MVWRFFIKVSGYLAFALIVGLFLVLSRFPYDTLAKRIEAEARQRFGCELGLEELKYQFPLSLAFSRVTIVSPDFDLAKQMVLDSGEMNIKPLALVSRKFGVDFSGNIFSGKMQGMIAASPMFSLETYALDLEWQGIDLAGLEVERKIDMLSSLQGSLSGELRLQGQLTRLIEASGSGRLDMKQGSLDLAVPGLKTIQLQELEGSSDFVLEKRGLAFEQIAFTGKGLRGKAQGSARLQSPLNQTELELEGRIDLNSAAPEVYSLARKHMNKTTFPFVLQGPLQGLTYRLR